MKGTATFISSSSRNSMAGRGSRLKGANGEREFFKASNELIGAERFMRHPNPWHGRGKQDNHDPAGELPVCVEVKRHERLNLPAWIAQAREQAGDDQVPVLAYRRNQEQWTVLAIMDLTEWGEYLKWKLSNSST